MLCFLLAAVAPMEIRRQTFGLNISMKFESLEIFYGKKTSSIRSLMLLPRN
jgi:hypothetical protein